MKNKQDFEPKDYPSELVEIIHKLLFQSVEHLESYRNTPKEELRQITREYIQEYLYNEQF